MNHHGPGIVQSLGLDPPNEPQQARGVIGHAVVGPAGEVELSNLSDLVSSSLRIRVGLNTQSTRKDEKRALGEVLLKQIQRIKCKHKTSWTRQAGRGAGFPLSDCEHHVQEEFRSLYSTHENFRHVNILICEIYDWKSGLN